MHNWLVEQGEPRLIAPQCGESFVAQEPLPDL